MKKTKIKTLEDRLKAFSMIIKKPLTLHRPDYELAVSTFNTLNLLYTATTGKEYHQKPRYR